MATRKLTSKEYEFAHDITERGLSLEDSFRAHWSIPPTYTDTRVRYEANKVAKRPHVVQYLEALVFERRSLKNLDEKFVIDLLKETAVSNLNTVIGVRSLELLGKTMGMFKERQIIEDPTGNRATADKLFELAEKLASGDAVESEINILEAKVEGVTTDDFEIQQPEADGLPPVSP